MDGDLIYTEWNPEVQNTNSGTRRLETVNRYALLSALCVLSFTQKLVAASADDVDKLAGKCAANDSKACVKIRNLTDQAALARLAFENKDERVWSAALDGLKDQALLAKIALEAKDAHVRNAAFARLTDQALQAKIATEDKDPDVRKSHVRKLTDGALLAKFALEDKDAAVRGLAVDGLTDQALLGKIAVEDQDADVRRIAAAHLTDGALLAEFALEDKDATISGFAAMKLTMVLTGANGGQLLVKAPGAREAGLFMVPNLPLARPMDQASLARLAIESKDPTLRRAAVGNLTDRALLAKIAAADQDVNVRGAAKQRLDQIPVP
jgi:hypothetical protein